MLFVVCCSVVVVARWLLPVERCSLRVAGCVVIADCVRFVLRCLLFVVCCLWLVVVMCVVCCLLFVD